MKSLLKNILALFAISLIATSCDYISEPWQSGEPPEPGDTNKVMRNILIDDFTGHKCNNCPKASDEIKLMESLQQFEGRVVAIGIHAGFFSTPSASPYEADYRTPEGSDLENLFSPSSFPIGMVNRIDYPTAHLINYPDWINKASAFLTEEASVDIQPSVNYNSSDSTFSVEVDLIHLKDISSISTKIVVLVTEDKIISAQKDGANTDLTYEHNHVLRNSTNTVFGEDVDFSGAAIGDTITYNTNGKLRDVSVPDNCHLVIYVYDATTQEIIQVVKANLK
ncbi:MAG: Omp28-related outer membrane protein [Schleiferiaceae bacterium]|nr:Omp28-related outer membrane protein [Schleiferiaceae bacterium]